MPDLMTLLHPLPDWAVRFVVPLIGFVFKHGLKWIAALLLRRLEKRAEPLRGIAASSPSRSAWTAVPDTKEYRIYEQMVKSNILIRSPHFPGEYMRPTRWH